MKRSLSVILTFAMLISMLTVFFVTNASAITVISNTSPAITANVGEKITLSDYSVVFDGATSAVSDVSWTDASGNSITTFTPTAKGVTKLTAKSGSNTKTIYVVAKNADESEYVLYEADMSDYNSISELESEGWITPAADSAYDLSGDTLLLKNDSDLYNAIQIILPQWLADFGDYSYTIDAKMNSSADTRRWLALSYRNAGLGWAPPYLHMCVRENTMASDGIELAERSAATDTTSVQWTLLKTAAGRVSSLLNAYHTFNVQAYGKNVRYNIDGSQVLYADLYSGNTNTLISDPQKGGLGISAAGCTVSVKTVKITVQENTPEKAELINNSHEEINLLNPIANVEYVSASELNTVLGSSAPGSVLLDASEYSDISEALQICIAKNALPTFLVASNAEADKVMNAMSALGCVDANAISETASVLSYIRSKNAFIRTGLIINDTAASLSSEEAHDIRVKVRDSSATFCILNSDSATHATVSELQALAVAVWIDITDSDSFEIDALKAVTSGANGIISDSANDLASAINNNLGENAMTRTPLVIGHRGNPTQASSNSLSGFLKAYENGADVIELDVRFTKDGKIIVLHDNTLNATTDYTGTATVSEMDYEDDILNYNLIDQNGNVTDEKVPLLSEVLVAFADLDCRIFVEFKGGTLEDCDATMQLIKEYGMEDRVCVIAFGYSYLVQTQESSAGMSTGYLYVPSLGNIYTVEEALEAMYEALNLVLPFNSTINPSYGVVRPGGTYFTQAATDRGITVWPWTFEIKKGEDTLDMGFFSGCDGVTTDDSQWFKSMAKYIEADEFILDVGSSYYGSVATVTTYGGTATKLDASDVKMIVLSGSSYIQSQNGAIIGKAEGEATVMFEYTTKSTYGTEYVLYTAPVTVNIKNSGTIVSADSYTTTAPNYEYGGADPDLFKDDGARLIDGIKSVADVDSDAYAAWKAASSPVEIVLDLGSAKTTDSYTVYTAGGFWSILPAAKLTVYGSTDGNSYTQIAVSNSLTTVGEGDIIDGISQSMLYSITATADKNVSYRYIKFEITANGTFLWIDEVEAKLVTAEDDGEDNGGDTPVTPTWKRGDVDNDKEITATDYLLLKRIYFGTLKASTLEDPDNVKNRCDVDKNSSIEAMDYLLLKRAYFGTFKIVD